jgi:hypothetical protein
MLAALALAGSSPALAGDEGPVIVIPSRPGVPVVINGCDASYAVVEGDWGLARPGFVPVTVYGCAPIRPNSVYERRSSYHPKYGHAPPRGRNEVEPPADRALPDPAEDFSRSWSTSSDVTPVRNTPALPRGNPQSSNTGTDTDIVPATITDPATFPQNFVPPAIIQPRQRQHH